jgi:hypothetical protein
MGRPMGGPSCVPDRCGALVARPADDRHRARHRARRDGTVPAPTSRAQRAPMRVRARVVELGDRAGVAGGAGRESERRRVAQAAWSRRCGCAARGVLEQREGLHERGGPAKAGGPSGKMRSEHVFANLARCADGTRVRAGELAERSQEWPPRLQPFLHGADSPPWRTCASGASPKSRR